jgi:hypothetical protein
MSEREKMIKAQAKLVMPMIGPLLDAWQGLPNDISEDEELVSIAEWMEKINEAMESAGGEE